MKKILFIALMATLGPFASNQTIAQSQIALSYSVGFPVGDLAKFITAASWRGVTFDYHAMVNQHVGFGFSTGWNVFYEEIGLDTYTYENQTLTGRQYRFSNHLPILFSAGYYFKPNSTLDPFFTLGIGTIYTERRTEIGIFQIEQDAWNFALVPEVGVLYDINGITIVSMSLQYYNGFQAGNELDAAQNYLAFKLGFQL